MLEYFDTDSEISQSGCPYRSFSEIFLNLCPLTSRKKGHPHLEMSLSKQFSYVRYSAAVTDVICGFTPSYQYRKPSISMTSPISRAFTAA